jgi:hypothetical protein
MASDIDTTIDIQSPPERIWELLTAFRLYDHWNPMIPKAEGVAVEQGVLVMVIKLPEVGEFTLKPVIVRLASNREITWKSRLRVPGILAWEHSFLIEPAGDRIRLHQKLRFSGILAPLFVLVMKRFLEPAAAQLNSSLRKWGEKEVRCMKC